MRERNEQRNLGRQLLSSTSGHYKEELGRRSTAKMLTRDGARRIAANVAKLPRGLRGKG